MECTRKENNMKVKKLFLLPFLLFAMSLAGCQQGEGEGDGGGRQGETIPVLQVKLSQSSLNLKVEQEAQLTATVLPDNATDKTVTWSSSDATVASVTAGKVKALKVGTATITAKAGDVNAKCTVTVSAKDGGGEADKLTVKLNQTTAEIEVGHSVSILDMNDSTGVTYTHTESGDGEIEVRDANTPGAWLLTGKTAGTVNFKVTARKGSESAEATCVVTVTAASGGEGEGGQGEGGQGEGGEGEGQGGQTQIAYKAFMGETEITLTDVTSTSDKGQDTWVEQYKGTANVTAGATLSFLKADGSVLQPGAPGEGNNAVENESTHALTVHNDAQNADLYLKIYADGGASIWLTGYVAGGEGGEGEGGQGEGGETEVVYKAFKGDTEITLTDVTDTKGEEDTWVKQFKGTVTVAKDDVLTFKKDTEDYFPGDGGEYSPNNNVKYNETTHLLEVLTAKEDAELYLKIYEDGGAAVWLTGYVAPVVVKAYSVIGKIGEENWTVDHAMTVNEGVASVALSLAAGDEFKIRVDAKWDENFGASALDIQDEDIAAAFGDGDDGNIAVYYGGDYTISLNISTGKIDITGDITDVIPQVYSITFSLTLTTTPTNPVSVLYDIDHSIDNDWINSSAAWHQMSKNGNTYTFRLGNLSDGAVVRFQFATWEEGYKNYFLSGSADWKPASVTVNGANLTLSCSADAFPTSTDATVVFAVA